jgi:hypothetical protein
VLVLMTGSQPIEDLSLNDDRKKLRSH